MGRPSPYSDEQKAAILEAVKSGRQEGKQWAQVLKEAEGAGYKGGLQYLKTLARSSGAVRRRGKRKTAKAARNTRRAKSRGKSKVTTDAGLEAIDNFVKKMVEERLTKPLHNAIGELQAAIDELNKVCEN